MAPVPRLAVRRQPTPAAVLAVAGFGAFLAFLDSTIVNVAFPNIQTSFPKASLSLLSWVLNGYNVVFAGCLVVAGRFADLIGRRRMFIAGTLLFTLASAGCAASTSVSLLIGSRVAQGLGCAMLVPASLAMVIEAFPAERLTEGMSLWAATAAVAAGLGPPVGGALVNAAGWRWVFLVNLPFGILAIVLARRTVVESRAPGRRQLPDLVGTALLVSGVTALTLAVTKGHDWGWTGLRVLITGLAALLLLTAFLRQNARHPVPVLDPVLLRARRFAVGNLITLVTGAGFYAYGLTHILWLRYVWHYSLLKAGLAVAPGALVAAVTTGLLARVAQRRGHRPLVVLGAVTWAGALVWYATRVGVHPDFLADWLPGQVISGIGVGATLPIISSAALLGIAGRRYGAASAVVSSTRQLGAVLGVAIVVAVIGSTQPSTAQTLRHGWAFSAGCFAMAAALALFLGDTRSVTVSEPPTDAVPRTPDPSDGTGPVVTSRPAPVQNSFLATVPDSVRERLAVAWQPVDLPAGEHLFHQGDEADGFYVVRAGQLDVVIDGVVVSRLGAGDAVGELALLTGSPRSASVRARRDSRLDHLSPKAFAQAVQTDPQVALSVATSVAARLQRLTPPQAPRSQPRVIAVVAADPAAPVRPVSAAIVRGLNGFRDAIDPGVVEPAGLERAESDHDRVVLTAPYEDDSWREFCLRSADRVVIVVGSPEGAQTRLVGEGQDCDLVFTTPVSRAELVDCVEHCNPISVHRLSETAHLDAALRALSARLAQRSVGLVLAGGGARSFAQLGVLDELERAGVLVDRVAGTSAGAVVAGLFAMGRTAAEVDAVIYEEFVRRNPLGDYTVPRHGLIRGERTLAGIRRHAGEVTFEELPRELRVVSADLLRRRPVIHSRGPVADAVAASLRIPGLFPPLRLGDTIHVDGTVLDNLPVSALAQVPDGPIIAVNISMRGGQRHTATARPPRIPGVAETLMRTMLMSSGPAAAAALASADVVITPRTAGVGMLEWHQIDVLRAAGREAALEAMPTILAVVRNGGSL